ncbi:Protein of unknown function DUF538 [Macleaya cordata]|uniref:Uncharacterized protein n=1 Tax=Macleaya cordata TaxID=56857 RepID=A0A200PNV0_MACCD|nr:Protein of unknown function DUF538 [Macleaya cordata]
MMASKAIENYRKNAEIFNSSEAQCKQKSLEILEELSLPKGLLPLHDLPDVWLKQKKKKEYFFPSIGTTVSYAPEVTAFVENRRIKKLTGGDGY